MPAQTDELLTLIQLAVTQGKRVEREVRVLKQMLANVRANVQPEEGTTE